MDGFARIVCWSYPGLESGLNGSGLFQKSRLQLRSRCEGSIGLGVEHSSNTKFV